MVMSAHIILSEIDPQVPGTLSATFLKDYLRGELNFSGVIISDDMEMHAITNHYGPSEAPILALNAGCDLLCYRTEEASRYAIASIEKAIQTGELVLRLAVEGNGGLAIYGEKFGMYPFEPTVIVKVK
jgi:beta-N-acetylhexosaminidase